MRHGVKMKDPAFGSVSQADFIAACATGSPVLLVRVKRTLVAGRFADRKKKPLAWTVGVKRGTQIAVITSQRGKRREWTELDSADDFLRSIGVRAWCVVNELD
jgi:hypothetical protein